MNSLLKVAVVCLVMLVACFVPRVILTDDADTEYNSDYLLPKRAGCKCADGRQETYYFMGCQGGWYRCSPHYVIGDCCKKFSGKYGTFAVRF
uniref:N.vectensis toxin 8 n=1 Tax=Nematostella vectensis TaxID=45351 RepID=NV8_NEMVE|nr:RecName: Full=N.vectensis toxin 8; Short=Nv8; Flags: Precursor [Nematostella vectensis]